MIELEPHFRQTGWFIAIIVVSIVGSGAALWFWRMQRIARKHRQLQQAHDLLETKVNDRTAELASSNLSLKNEIEERKRVEMEVERIHRELMHASRTAGQAEVASSVLHNVGNVLNSVNVAASIATDRVRAMRVENLRKAAKLIRENQQDLHRFLTEDKRGKRLPEYLSELSDQLADQQKQILHEIRELSGNIDHIKEIVSMQQNYARILGINETFAVADVVEGALKMHLAAFRRHSVQLVREFQDVPPVTVDRHKVLQILVNLLHNAKYACDDSRSPDKRVIVRIQKLEQIVRVDVKDNGVGIAPENMTRIFSHGFTTRKNGHGFGLHSSAIAAKELGGNLSAHSDGPGQGATFSLELPTQITGSSD
jgi:C4-dicarboxylate-specific signal transduction histidine kinase